MDAARTSEHTTDSEVKDVPPIPLKTYQWEELRRARKKGGYPWTYLDKPDFEEVMETEPISKSRSSSELESNKSEVTIVDVTDKEPTTPISGQEFAMDVTQEEDAGVQESANSSTEVSISQYLDENAEELPTSTAFTHITHKPLNDEEPRQPLRAKSEEPTRKRKHSIDSSYSRASKYSLSKLGVMRRLKDATSKIKMPKFTFSKSEGKLNKKEEAKKPSEAEKIEPRKVEGPLYIHIPLKPPEGENDEKKPEKRPSPIKEESTVTPETPETPESPGNKGIQFIILTAPSDDEILDDPSVPETPASVGSEFFDNKKDELKTLAKDVVEEISPESKRRFISSEHGVIIEEIEETESPNTERSKSVEPADSFSKTKKKHFDFATIPRKIKKKAEEAEQATISKIKSATEALKGKEEKRKKEQKTPPKISPLPKARRAHDEQPVRIPLHSEESMDRESLDLRSPEVIEEAERMRIENLKDEASRKKDEKVGASTPKSKTTLNPDSIRIPLHSEESMDRDSLDLQLVEQEDGYTTLPDIKRNKRETTSNDETVKEKDKVESDEEKPIEESKPKEVEVQKKLKVLSAWGKSTKSPLLAALSKLPAEEKSQLKDSETTVEDKPQLKDITPIETSVQELPQFDKEADAVEDKQNVEVKKTKETKTSIKKSDSFRIPLHSEESMDRESLDLRSEEQRIEDERIKEENVRLERETTPKAEIVVPVKQVAPQPVKSVKKKEEEKKLFDFSTIPRTIKKKAEEQQAALAKLKFSPPWKAKPEEKSKAKKEVRAGDVKKMEKSRVEEPETVRIPLHSEESMDREILDFRLREVEQDDEQVDMTPTTEEDTFVFATPIRNKSVDNVTITGDTVEEDEAKNDDVTAFTSDDKVEQIKAEEKPPEEIKPEVSESEVREQPIDKTKQEEEPTAPEIKPKKKKKVKKVKSKEEKLLQSQKTDDDKLEEKKVHEADSTVPQEAKPLTTMSIDEEDGLKTEIVIAKIIDEEVKARDKVETEKESEVASEQKEELKSSIKSDSSPVLKKKVSFKRRSKDEAEGIYEDIQVRTDDPNAVDLTVSMSVEEEKTYLDQRIIKETSLEDDYNKWSKLHDHEYEPVNPPAEEPATLPSAPAPTPVPAPTKASTPVSDREIETVASNAASESRTTGITIQEPQRQGAEADFIPIASVVPEAEPEDAQAPAPEPSGSKFQTAFRSGADSLRRQASIISEKASTQAGKIQTRVASIKRPKLTMPKKPKFSKPNLPKLKIGKPTMPKFERPKMPKFERPHMPKFEKPHMPKMPKIPDQMKISMPTFTLPKRANRRQGMEQRRQYSTESNAGDTKPNKIFDFSTYPRIFSRKGRDAEHGANTPRTGTDITPVSERTTLPRFSFGSRWKGKFTEVKPAAASTVGDSLMSKESERSTDTRESVRIPLHSEGSMDRESLQDLQTRDEEREDSVERRMAAVARRYDEDDMDDEYLKENQAIHLNAQQHERWSHGKFHENLNIHADEEEPEVKPQPQITDLDVEAPIQAPTRKYAGSSGDIHRRGVLEEINQDEFFLRQKGISQDNIEVGAYLSSEIREAFRTPNNALSQLHSDYDQENTRTSDLSLPEAPKRRPMKKPKRKKTPHVSQEFPYDQESLHTEPEEYPKYYQDDFEPPERPKRRNKKKQFDLEDIENQILPDDSFLTRELSDQNILSEPSTYYKDYRVYENERMEGREQPGIIVSDPYQEAFFRTNFSSSPTVPPRKQKSEKSLTTSEHDSITGELNGHGEITQTDVDPSYRQDHEYQIPTPEVPPKRPTRTRSRTRSGSRATTQLGEEEELTRFDSMASDLQQCEPCLEEPCERVTCDYMGYSVIDKSKVREPPLPPAAPRRKRSVRSTQSEEDRFFTVPRRLHQVDQPVRPMRNYSTLGPSRPPRKHSITNLTDEEKVSVNGSQYIEIEDDHKNLQSGEVIQKMKDRPLPAPPRPPRKSRESSRSASRGAIPSEDGNDFDDALSYKDTGVSIHTESIPGDLECEDIEEAEEEEKTKPRKAVNEFEHQETITHGALIVQPYGANEIVDESPLQLFSKSTERIITVRKEYADDDTKKEDDYDSEIPEDFKKLKDPEPKVIERIIEKHIPIKLDSVCELETLKTQKLQVSDLDVDRLAVNELHASKIKVGEIESSSINVSEINSSSGNLIVSGIELPASFFQQLVEKLQAEQHNQPKQEGADVQEIRATVEEIRAAVERIEQNAEARLPEIPERHVDDVEEPEQAEDKTGKKKTPIEEDLESPQRPPRTKEQSQEAEPEESEESPPPRPPQPDSDYIPSQPPATFYSLRTPQGFQDFEIDEDIPVVPRRRRHHHHHHKAPPPGGSSSTDDVPHSSRRRHPRSPEPSIPQLTGQLGRACVTAADRSLKRLIQHITHNVLGQTDSKQDSNLVIVILLVLIASLILLGWGNGRNVHHHHWEYFNPPRDL